MLEEETGKILKEKKLRISTAESCTGGVLANRITNVSGSSDYFERGFITYSVKAKEENLGVSKEIIEKFGVVSNETAVAMAEGVKKVSGADIGIGITGIAGPSGGSKEKPVGTVCIGISGKKTAVKTFHFKGSRTEIKNNAADEALKMLKNYLVSLHNNDVMMNSHENINDEKIRRNNRLSQVVKTRVNLRNKDVSDCSYEDINEETHVKTNVSARLRRFR
jgi:nicotinamide-nucleotide amidase